VLSAPLPLAAEPFAVAAERLGMSQQGVVDALAGLIRRGVVRRVAGILKHDKAGFRSNAMVAFLVPPRLCKKAGAAAAAFPFVTHCYWRKSYPDWPYTLYAMVHAKSKTELKRNIASLKAAVQGKDMLVLPTVKEFKKTSFDSRASL
jgi:DNA-binding Lrp family transcriptional regulator